MKLNFNNQNLDRWMSFPYYKTFMPPEFDKLNGRADGVNGDMYIFRLTETYLLRAEAYYWKNQMVQAANDINKLRTKANANEISAGDVTID
jgi:starch-binding outer membrane protein, SusD/RagB family